jgi:hypothetical protein
VEKYEGFRKAGSFTLATGTEVQGELCLKGAATTLDLYSSESFDTHASPDICGQLHDRRKVSLINCITLSTSTSGAPGNEYHQCSRVFPHFVIFGDQHINSSNRTIRRVSFTVDDAPMLFHDCDAFGEVIKARPHMERIVEASEGAMKIEIGEYPQLFYYTGKREILVVDTVLGRISVRHGISYTFPGPEGIHVDNTIRLNLTFDSERTIEEAVTGVLDILRFLEVIAGRRQNISELTFVPVSNEEHPRSLDVCWCMPPHRDFDDGSHRPHPFDLPIRAATNPSEFAIVLKRWLERNDAWRNASAVSSRRVS